MTDERTASQRPEAWSAGAVGYGEAFEPFTSQFVSELLDLAGVGAGTELLDVAAGTGALSAAACARGATVLATDFAPGMVEHLERRLADEGCGTATTAVMDGQDLDLDDDRFDVACSSFGVIFFPDLDAGLLELVRVVRPGGRVGVSSWDLDGFRLSGLVAAAVAAAVDGFEVPTGGPPWARVGSADGLADALRAASLADVEVRAARHPWQVPDPAAYFLALPSWSPPSHELFAALDDEQVTAAADAFAALVADAQAADGIHGTALLGVGVVADG